MSSDSKRGRLPFEPRPNKKKKSPQTQTSATQDANSPSKTTPKSKVKAAKNPASLSAIPDVVSKRMARRMVFFCGVPSALGMSSLVGFYWLFERGIIDFPPYLALFVSIGFLALGVGGLSFGIFSASWDEDRVGSLLGIEELKINLPRTLAAWRNGSKQGN
ncbi:MAG: PAM68 family protein [Pleurocapsa sp.]